MVTQRRRWGGMRLPLGAEEGLDTRTPTHRLHTAASVICIFFIFTVVVAILVPPPPPVIWRENRKRSAQNAGLSVPQLDCSWWCRQASR